MLPQFIMCCPRSHEVVFFDRKEILVPQGHKRTVATLGKCRGPPQNPTEPCGFLGETPEEASKNPSERQISSESLAEGCAPRIVTLRKF